MVTIWPVATTFATTCVVPEPLKVALEGDAKAEGASKRRGKIAIAAVAAKKGREFLIELVSIVFTINKDDSNYMIASFNVQAIG